MAQLNLSPHDVNNSLEAWTKLKVLLGESSCSELQVDPLIVTTLDKTIFNPLATDASPDSNQITVGTLHELMNEIENESKASDSQVALITHANSNNKDTISTSEWKANLPTNAKDFIDKIVKLILALFCFTLNFLHLGK